MSHFTTSARRQAAVWINKSIQKSEHRESEILTKEFRDIFGIIIDSAKDMPMIPTTFTGRAETPQSDDELFFFCPEDLFYNSRSVAASLHNDMQDLYFQGLGELYSWPDMYEIHFLRWGFTAVWTTGDLTALALSIHSRFAMNNEILTTEFIALYRLALTAWRTDKSSHQRIEREIMEKQSPQSSACQPVSRRLPIRLISIHNHNIRILSTIITDEYFFSFKKDSPPSSSKLHVHIKSISVAEYSYAKMKDLAKELFIPKNK
ncbi:d4b99b30-8c00-4bdd-a81f-f2663abfa402 [Sclerotinia trifoliorum]|uniref:D4b99b30-8c00-4bdd-a81f-f2663abfa402 n=1 Tax=Sclerotinia trifoliorum TaxID=28548 RepID=A0A8H2W3A2_9HELO|nr:d4b99b30-8c00-4bdd-a81f-f2663abfa402 [Sclerotinia trifoliorum]